MTHLPITFHTRAPCPPPEAVLQSPVWHQVLTIRGLTEPALETGAFWPVMLVAPPWPMGPDDKRETAAVWNLRPGQGIAWRSEPGEDGLPIAWYFSCVRTLKRAEYRTFWLLFHGQMALPFPIGDERYLRSRHPCCAKAWCGGGS